MMTAWEAFLQDKSMGDKIQVNIPAQKLNADGSELTVEVNRNTPATYIGMSNVDDQVRGTVSIDDNAPVRLFMQPSRGPTEGGDGKAHQLASSFDSDSIVFLKPVDSMFPAGQDKVKVKVTFKPVPVLRLNDLASTELPALTADQPELTLPVRAKAHASRGLYQIVSSDPVILTAPKGDFYFYGEATNSDNPSRPLIVRLNGTSALQLKVRTLPGTYGVKPKLTLQALPEGTVTQVRNVSAVDGEISGTLASISDVQVFDLDFPANKIVIPATLSPTPGKANCCAFMQVIDSDADVLQQIFEYGLHDGSDSKSTYFNANYRDRVVVTYSGSYQDQNPKLDYKFKISPK